MFIIGIFDIPQKAFLAVLVPQDLEKRWHPIWLAIRSLLSENDIERPPVLEDSVTKTSPKSITRDSRAESQPTPTATPSNYTWENLNKKI